jgi:8-amino-7-oxononanoate synthase
MQWLDEELAKRKRLGLLRVRRSVQSAQGIHVCRGGRAFFSFASNDYLGLATDPRLAKAAAGAARRFGCGAGASPLVHGYLTPHRKLEHALARWENVPETLVFSSGFLANVAVVSTLAAPEDAIFSDALNHASIIDGCRLSRARVHIYRHADVNHLAEMLRREGVHARRRLIVTDTVFSMDGDLAPVAELLELAEQHDALLVLDEAHATGVMGEHGRGVSELMLGEFQTERIIKVGTLSKALGSQGGFVCGSRRLIEWLVNHARPYIFSTALAPPAATAARRALAIVQAEPEARRRLQWLAAFLRERLHDAGLGSSSSASQIVPLIVGAARTALRLAAALKREGLLVPAIRPPAVAPGTARLRISLSAGHTEDDVLRLVSALQTHRHYFSESPCHAQPGHGDRIS